MDSQRFDSLAKYLGQNRSRRSIIAGLVGGALVGRLGIAELAHAGRKRKRCDTNADCRSSQVCSANGRCVSDGRCGDLFPLCENCMEPRCDTATGEYVCRTACADGWNCCNGLCEPPCDNGCELNPAESCICSKPPAGDVYCAVSHRCGSNPCPGGKPYDSATCSCNCAGVECGLGKEVNPTTCACECAGGGSPCGDFCCPSGFPYCKPGAICCADPGGPVEECVCVTGFELCYSWPGECCLQGW
jgi:hypothetical protein